MPTLDELAAETPAMSSGSSLDEMATEADLDQRFDKEDADRDAIGLPRLSDVQRQSTKRRLLVPQYLPQQRAPEEEPAPDHSFGSVVGSYAKVPLRDRTSVV